jgi:SAM-dependent methyltransferase
MPAAVETFNGMKQRWIKVAGQRGAGYVGRVSESTELQARKIESLLLKALSPDDFYKDGIDFGCGYGRFIPTLSHYCGHIWAIDLLDSMLAQAASAAPNVTVVPSTWPISFAIPPVDFLWAGLVIQHIVDEPIYQATIAELKRLLKPGARVILLDNAVDLAPHVKPRGPEMLARHLELRPGWKADRVTINQRPNDHWFIDGYKA